MSLNLPNQKFAQTAEEKSTERKVRLLWRSSWDLLDIYGLSFHPTTAKPRTQTPPVRTPSTGSRTLTNRPSEEGIYIGTLGGELNRRSQQLANETLISRRYCLFNE